MLSKYTIYFDSLASMDSCRPGPGHMRTSGVFFIENIPFKLISIYSSFLSQPHVSVTDSEISEEQWHSHYEPVGKLQDTYLSSQRTAGQPDLPTHSQGGRRNGTSREEEGTALVKKRTSRRNFRSLPQLLRRKLTWNVFFKGKLPGSWWKLARGCELCAEGICRIALCSVDHCLPIILPAHT